MDEQLLALAERCEAATGPDRELSAAIALAVHDWLHEAEGNKPLNCRVRNAVGSPVYIGGTSTTMDYTASLDAAMTLVENIGCVAWTVNACPYGSAIAEIYLGNPGPMFGTEAATPALALTAASLRSRSHKGGSNGE